MSFGRSRAVGPNAFAVSRGQEQDEGATGSDAYLRSDPSSTDESVRCERRLQKSGCDAARRRWWRSERMSDTMTR